MEVVVGIGSERQRSEATLGYIDIQFLLKLPDQRRFRRFSIVDFTAGELPQTRHRLAFRPLGHQNPPVDIDKAHGRNEHEWEFSPRHPVVDAHAAAIRSCNRH